MRKLHERLQAIFNRIGQPEYLHSPRRGHSARGYAEIHSSSKMIAKLDIRQFYPSTTDEHVFRLFYYRMDTTHDVAGLLTELCTVDGRLPFGSPPSQILCTLVHRDLFDQIDLHCKSMRLRMSLWVDDITISGGTIPESPMWTVKYIIHAKGLEYHKVMVRSRHLGAVVTGHYLHRDGIAAANKHHPGVRDSLVLLDSTTDAAGRLKLINSLIGKTNHARGIYGPSSPVRGRLDRRRDWLHSERRRIQRQSFTTPAVDPARIVNYADGELPWSSTDDDVRPEYPAALSSSDFVPDIDRYEACDAGSISGSSE